MTIAACYLSSEGVVLGADSMITIFVRGQTENLRSIITLLGKRYLSLENQAQLLESCGGV